MEGAGAGWSVAGAGYQVERDSVAPHSGGWSVRTRRTGTGVAANLTQLVARPGMAGRLAAVHAYIRTERVDGRAGLVLGERLRGGAVKLYTLEADVATGTTPWRRHQFEVVLDSAAEALVVGVAHAGGGTAWFDSVGVDFREAPPARRYTPAPGLLTDERMTTGSPAAALPNAEWAAWIRRNMHPVRSLTEPRDFSDLGFLKTVLRGKRIVQLGESGHGVAEFNEAKVRLVRYLHEELGYDVIAFESSLSDCYLANRDAGRASAESTMDRCIFGVWRTDEVLPLFEYIRSTHATARPLTLAGFDTQPSTGDMDQVRVLREVVARVDSAYARRISTLAAAGMLNWESRARPGLDTAAIATFDSAARWIDAHRGELVRAGASPADVMVARQSARSAVYRVRQMTRRGTTGSSEARDAGMAENLDAIAGEMYPGKRVIVWAHNAHIRHAHHLTPERPFRSMGGYVAERHRGELYTVGLYMGRGRAAWNDRIPYDVLAPPAGGLEAVLGAAGLRGGFVDLLGAGRSAGSEWMFQRLPALNWGSLPDAFVPAEQYDGLLYIDTVRPPAYRPSAMRIAPQP